MRGLLISILVFAVQSLALANQPPVANAGANRNAYAAVGITLLGSATDVENDPIVYWIWTVEQAPAGAQYLLLNETTQYPYFSAATQGDYVLSLLVEDPYASSLPDYTTVHVADNLPPVAVATADKTTITVGGTVCFDGSKSYDPEGGPLSYIWNFGDGTPEQGVVSLCHAFTSIGLFSVTLTAIDERNAFDTDVVAIAVNPPVNHPPVASPTVTPNTGEAPLTVEFAANASDPDEDLLTYAWNFGDPLNADNNSTLENPTHIYDQNGFYHVALDVCDGLATINRSITIRAGIYDIDYLLGDIDFDGDVDFADVNEFTSAYLSENGDPDYNSDADLNSSDCFIDLYDFALLANDWGETLP